MKVLIFLSRVAFICNLFFVAAIILWYLETTKKSTGSTDVVMEPGFITSTIIVLGYSAVFLNASLAIVYLVLAIRGSGRSRLPVWLVVANLVFLFTQLYFFFFL